MPDHQGIPFIGQDGFYPDWAKGSGRWVFQRTLVSVGGMLEVYAGLSALVSTADEIIVWVPKRRGIMYWLGTSALHDERRLALNQLADLRMRCYGDDCPMMPQSVSAAKSLVDEAGVYPERWHLICPSCTGQAGPDLECVQAGPIIERWNALAKPVVENPAASAAIRSVRAITDLAKWVKGSQPSHLELAYVGQQLWPNIADMLEALTTGR
jgi:hypothetical protein